ncbi:hypothetical protein MMC30_006356 [Trapelia coarctata]|nr:hypothetical protein [Trapelia coarctata]
MATRTTRGAAAKEAALFAAAGKTDESQQQSNPPVTPINGKSTKITKASAAKTSRKTARKTPVAKSPKAKSSAPKSKANTPKPTQPDASSEETNGPPNGENTVTGNALPNAKSSKKRKRMATLKVEADPGELPHGLGRIKRVAKVMPNEAGDDIDPPIKAPDGETVTLTKKDVEDIKATMDTTIVASNLAAEESPTKRARKLKKANPYGVTLGQSPYPDLLRPTPKECEEVNTILTKEHGKVAMPEEIPLPSLTVAGCGEVPCVLEALLRTLLSAHTSNSNAALAVQGLIKRFGVLKSGRSAGCIDWNAARLAGREEIETAIKRGGLAPTKSKSIMGILDMVYLENEARRAALAAKAGQLESGQRDNPIDPKTDTVDPDLAEAERIDRTAEVMLADTSVLTLDYVHAMSASTAFEKLIAFPGIGVKTASCTLLFCMQRPSFAVDTHVFRLCKWLGWVPQNATRDTTFAHCDVRVPDSLKYSLHQLLIKHGKACGRCRAITGESSEGWEKGCVIDELVVRTGKKKGGKEVEKAGKPKKGTEVDEVNGGETKKGKGKKVTSAKAKGKGAPTKAKGPTNPKRQVKSKKAAESEVDTDDEEADMPLVDVDEEDGSEYGAE